MSGTADVLLFEQLVSQANALFLSNNDTVTINGVTVPTLKKIYAQFLASMSSYTTIADGLAATSGTGTNNRFFTVPAQDGTFEVRYRNDSGVQVEVGRTQNGAIVDAVISPTTISFGSLRPVIDSGGAYGGGPAVYMPRSVYQKRGSVVMNISNAGPADSTELPGYVKLVIVTTGINYLWYDIAANLYKVASFTGVSPVLPTEKFDQIIQLMSINGLSVVSEIDFAYAENLAEQIVLPSGALIVDGSELLIPPYYYRSAGAGLGTLLTPADGSGYFRQALSVSSSSAVSHVHDQAAADRGLTAQKVITGNSVPRASGWKTAIFARSLNKVVSTQLPVAGDVPGGSVKNQCPYGINADSFPRRFGSTVIADVSSAVLTALGLTRGAADPTARRPYVGMDLSTPFGGSHAFFRAYYQTDQAGVFGTPRVFIWTSSASVQTINLTLEADISPVGAPNTVRIYSASVQIVDRNDLLYYLIGTESQATSANVLVAGVQAHLSQTPAFWIRKGDYPSALGTDDRLAALEKKLPDTAVNVLLPPHMFLNAGQQLPIFAANVMQERSDVTNFNLTFSTLKNNRPWINQSRDTLLVDGDRVGSTATFGVRRFGAGILNYRSRLELSTYVAPASAAGTVKVLSIGDSLTNRFTVVYLQERLAAMGLTATMIGTMNNNGAQAEGRESREYADYIYEHTDAVSPVAVGSEAAYLANEAGKLTSNPFLKVPTTADNTNKPTMIKNGYIFDMRFYLDRFSFADPDFVICNLYTNDILQQTETVATGQIDRGMTIMYAQIREALPNAHIAFVTNPRPRGVNADLSWTTCVNAAILPHLAFVKSKRAAGDTKVWLLPMHAHLSQENAWPITVESTNASTGVEYGQLSDSVHFDERSRRQYAEVTSAWVGALRT
jgi:hypothetical protein